MVTLIPVNSKDVEFLYELLKNRDPKANISHIKMPTFSQHKKFVLSKPYSKWYIIYHNKNKVGSIYLSKQNEIGIFLLKEFQGKKIGSKALKILMIKNPRERYLANVNPKNKASAEFFKNHHFNLIQYTYELRKK